jgi:hypothetical protein
MDLKESGMNANPAGVRKRRKGAQKISKHTGLRIDDITKKTKNSE